MEILKINVPAEMRKDEMIWVLEQSGDFSAKSMHRDLVKEGPQQNNPHNRRCWKELWKLQLHERLKLMLWKSSM